MRSSSRLTKLLLGCCFALGVTAPRAASAARPAFAYVNANPDRTNNSLPAFRVAGDGQSTPIAGSPYATGGLGLAPAVGAEFAHRIEVSRSQNLLFAANDGSGSIAVFTVNPLTGSLSPVSGSPFSVPGWSAFSGISLAVSNDGQFLYASGTTVVSFFIDAGGGLSEIGSEWSFGQRVGGVGVSGDNTRLFLSTPTRVVILHTGELGLSADPPDFLSIGSTPADLRLDAPGARLWVGTKNGGILAYSLTSGTETIVPGAPFFSGVSNLSGLSADFYGRFLFAFAPDGPRLLGARTNPDGSLVLGPNSPLGPALAPTGGALTPDGSFLLLTDARGQLDAWSTDDNAALTHAAGYPISTGGPLGFASVATFPDKNPTPAPATPVWLALALAVALAGLGARRAL
jgi:DNA-binding beta-propeller fold protein YncE